MKRNWSHCNCSRYVVDCGTPMTCARVAPDSERCHHFSFQELRSVTMSLLCVAKNSCMSCGPIGQRIQDGSDCTLGNTREWEVRLLVVWETTRSSTLVLDHAAQPRMLSIHAHTHANHLIKRPEMCVTGTVVVCVRIVCWSCFVCVCVVCGLPTASFVEHVCTVIVHGDPPACSRGQRAL